MRLFAKEEDREAVLSVLDLPEGDPPDVVVVVGGGPAPSPGAAPVVVFRPLAPTEWGHAHGVVYEPEALGPAVHRAWLRHAGTPFADERWLEACRRALGAAAVTVADGGRASDTAPSRNQDGTTSFVVPLTAERHLVVQAEEGAAARVWGHLQDARGWLAAPEAHPTQSATVLRRLGHDARSPAFVLRLAAQLLEGQGADPAVVERIRTSTARLLEVIDEARAALGRVD